MSASNIESDRVATLGEIAIAAKINATAKFTAEAFSHRPEKIAP